jgi:site-specific recombinase XerD
MSGPALQNLKSGPGGPPRAKVGHGPLSASNSFQHKERPKWTASQPETYPKEEHRLVAHFLSEAKRTGHRTQGLIGLRSRIPWLLEYLSECGLSIPEVGIEEALEYQASLIRKGRADGRPYCNSTVLAYLKAASQFFDFLLRRGEVASNPFSEIRRVRPEKRLPRNLPKESDMERLLAELSRFDSPPNLNARITRYRVHVIAECMYATGIRSSEAASLRVEDIDFGRSLVRIREGKGGAPRTAYINRYALELLRLYVEKIRPLILAKRWARRGLLFCCDWMGFGKLMNRTLRALTSSLSLPRFTSHDFRHSLGYHLLRAGCNIRHIQQILGHKRLRNTEIYTKVDREELREVLDAFHPRKWRA